MIRATPQAGDSNVEIELPKPGILGRFIRLGLGVGVLLLLIGLLTAWRDDLWAGRPPFEVGFAVLVVLALTFTSYVFDIALGLQWGQRTLAGILLGAGVAGLGGLAVRGSFPNAWIGIYVWGWLVAFCTLLGPAHLLAAALGTPGCEMRSYAHLRALLRGGDVSNVACPGGIDRLDHIGSHRQTGG